ncbi:MAG: RadC family protein [Acidiferrobacter sp.]
MAQLPLFDPARENALMVRDARGHYRPATPEQVLTAARAIVDQTVRRETSFATPNVAKDYVRAKLSGLEHEVFAALFLTAQNQLIEYVELFRGTITQSMVYPREVIKEALARNAAALIIAHNHPSGRTEPSAADRQLTVQLRDTLALVDVRLLDHVLVAGNETVSFQEMGMCSL